MQAGGETRRGTQRRAGVAPTSNSVSTACMSASDAASHLPSPRAWGCRCPYTLLSAASLADSSNLFSVTAKPSLYQFLIGPASRRYQQLHRPAGAPERAGLCDIDVASARIYLIFSYPPPPPPG